MYRIRIKRFSIQSGGPRKSSGLFGEFKNKGSKYIPIGALVGAGYGVISEDEGIIKSSIKGAGIGIMIAALDTALSYFRRKDVKKMSANDIITKLRENSPITPNDYTVNSDPYSSKLSVAISNGIMILFLNNLSKFEIDSISDLLDKYCIEDRYSEYKSEGLDNGGYIVTVVLPSSSMACDLLSHVINSLKIKINIVSEISESNKKFSEYDSDSLKSGLLKKILKKNKILKKAEELHPGLTDEIIDSRSISPLIDQFSK